MAQTKTEKELQLQVCIGRNLKAARMGVARMSLQKVMKEIWGISDNKNRISEIETGSRMPSPYVLVRLSLLYGVSLDFICGLSTDIERDLECSRAGQITQGLREIAIDTVDRIGMALAQQVAKMPRHETVVLNEDVQQMVHFLKNNINEETFKNPVIADQFYDCLKTLSDSSLRMSSAIAKHSRIMELTVFDHISRSDNNVVNEYLTDNQIDLDRPLNAVEFLEEDTEMVG